MNRLYMSKESRQSLQNARLSLEKTIRGVKAILRQPHTQDSGASEAQSQLRYLKRDATLLYTLIAASRGHVHCPTSEEALEGFRKRAARNFAQSEVEKLLVKVFEEAATTPAVVPNAGVVEVKSAAVAP